MKKKAAKKTVKKASRKKPLLDKESQIKYDNACETKESITPTTNEKEQPRALLQNNKFVAVEYDATSLAAIQQIAEALCWNANACYELAKVFGSSHVSVDHMLHVGSPAHVNHCEFKACESDQAGFKKFAMQEASPDKGEWGQALAGGMYNVKGKNKGFYRG